VPLRPLCLYTRFTSSYAVSGEKEELTSPCYSLLDPSEPWDSSSPSELSSLDGVTPTEVVCSELKLQYSVPALRLPLSDGFTVSGIACLDLISVNGLSIFNLTVEFWPSSCKPLSGPEVFLPSSSEPLSCPGVFFPSSSEPLYLALVCFSHHLLNHYLTQMCHDPQVCWQ